MINIRPVSDLRNKYPEIEDLVLKEDEAVYLTKNGYGSMVVLSLEKYTEMIDEIKVNKTLEEKFGNINVDKMIKETEVELDNPDTVYLTDDEVFSKARRVINGKK